MTVLIQIVVGVAALVLVGNLAIFGAHRWARGRAALSPAAWGAGTKNAYEVLSTLWRSGRPSPEGYAALAAAGAHTVIDLRAEGGSGPDPRLGLDHITIPVRDGRTPDPAALTAVRAVLDGARGPVLVHCSAGVGRTGSMVAARLVLDEGCDTETALVELLAVGPPSLEQIAFVRGLPRRLRPGPATVVLSRILDAPRRGWSELRRLLYGRRRGRRT